LVDFAETQTRIQPLRSGGRAKWFSGEAQTFSAWARVYKLHYGGSGLEL